MSPFEFITSSFLVSAAIAAAIALTLFFVLCRESRVRPDAVWVHDYVVSILFAPVITVLIAAAAVFTIITLQTWGTQPPAGQELAVAGAAVLLIFIVRTLTAPRRDARAEAGRRGTRNPAIGAPNVAAG